MRVATLRKHPTDASFVLLAVGPELNPTMGRFEPARLSVDHKAYLIHVDDIEALGRFLRIHDVAVADERKRATTAAPAPFNRGPFTCTKCYDCDYTQRDCHRDCDYCHRCHNCGSTSLATNYVIDPDEQQDTNTRGLAKVRPMLTGWPLDVNADYTAGAAAARTALKEGT